MAHRLLAEDPSKDVTLVDGTDQAHEAFRDSSVRLEQSLRNVGRESRMARLKEVMSVKRQMGAVSPLNDLFCASRGRADTSHASTSGGRM